MFMAYASEMGQEQFLHFFDKHVGKIFSRFYRETHDRDESKRRALEYFSKLWDESGERGSSHEDKWNVQRGIKALFRPTAHDY